MLKIIIILFSIVTIKMMAQSDSVVTYFNNGNIESIVHTIDDVRDGDAKFFWENGKIKEELAYVNGRVQGLVRKYNQDGILREMFTIEDGKREGPTSLFDSTGKYITDNYYEEGILVVDKIVLDAGYQEENVDELVAGINTREKQKNNNQSDDDQLPPVIGEEKNYENDTTFFTNVEVMPEPYGGMEALYKKIGYPYKAKEEEIEGTVKVLVFVDRDGEVLDVQVLEGIGYGCDEVVKSSILYHRFKPGLIRGQKVKVQMEISIEFKLGKES